MMHKCISCDNEHDDSEMITYHELKNVYGNVFSTLYICKSCDEKRKEEEKLRRQQEQEKANREYEEFMKMRHDSNYDSFIDLKILDVLSNKNSDVEIRLEKGRRIYFNSKDGDSDVDIH